MADKATAETELGAVLTQEQDALLDQYLHNLDAFFENQKNAQKIQVEIETLHLKKILSA